MKSKKVLSLALAFVFSLSFVFFLPLNKVSALTLNNNHYYGFTLNVAKPWIEALDNNASWPSQISKDHFYCCLTFDNSQGSPILKRLVLFDQNYSRTSSNSSFSYIAPTSYYIQYGSFSISTPSQLSNVSLYNYAQSGPGSAVGVIGFDSHYFMTYINSSGDPLSSPPVFDNYSSITFPSFDFSYQDNYLEGVIVGFDFSVDAFYDWLVDTGKISEIPSYIASSKVKSLLDFYKNWGGSNSTFISKVIDFFSQFNIVNQSLENRSILKSILDNLYQEYCSQAYVTIKHDSSILPHHRKNIETVTTDDDLTLVTDDANDDIYTSLLRDILRGIISIPGQIYNCTEMIISKLDYLNWNVTVSNDGGSSSGSDLSPVLNKMDDIIEALGSDTVSVDIDQNTIDDTDQFFDDWNLEFQSALDDKFPVASQLSTLFTDFWEKCGIDVDNDGETFEYYNSGVLESRSVVRSLDSAGTSESDIVTDFLNQFDDSDPAFLDDASFNSVPDLSVSIGGSDVSIFDFRVYAKYRHKIHFIISLVIWSLYLLHLYKALPTIIGQVADVAVKITDD